jgi:hypothetical protein
MPPAADCARFGAGIDADRTLDDTLRARHEEGVWVNDGGLKALCRKEQGGWKVRRENIFADTPGISILREQP